MAKNTKPKPSKLGFEQVEMLANFSDYAADYPNLTFEQIRKKLGVDFSEAENGKAWANECRKVFEMERGS